jgi:hypothetical protein
MIHMSNEKAGELHIFVSELQKIKTTPLRELTTKDRERFWKAFGYFIQEMLEETIREKNWVVGVILSASALEDISKRELAKMFNDKVKSERIDHLTFEETIMFLLASKKIDQKTYSKLMGIKETRNDIAHDIIMQVTTLLATFLKKEEPDLERTIRNAIECLDVIASPIVL